MSKFVKGECPNPSGRPKGSGIRQKLFTESVAPQKQAITDKAIQLAINGNETLLKFFLTRLLPPAPQDEAIEIEELQGSFVEKCNQLIAHMTAGNLTPIQGYTLIQSITSGARIEEITELKSIVERLEAQLK